MNHQDVQRRMGAYLQGDLGLAQRALFDAHLDGCPACTEELRALRTTVHLLRNLPTPDVPPHLADRVVARIEDGEGRARWWDGLAAFWSLVDPSRYLPPLAAAAVTSAVVIVGVRDLGWQIPGLQAPPARHVADAAGPASAGTAAAPSPTPAAEPAPAPVFRLRSGPDLLLRPGTEVVRSGPEAARRPAAEGGTGVIFWEGPAPLLQAPFGARAAPELPPAPPARSPEEDLELALDDPQAFVQHYRALQGPEAQDAWLAAVAERAARRRSVHDVVQRLRSHPDGHDLAQRFEGAARAVSYPSEGR